MEEWRWSFGETDKRVSKKINGHGNDNDLKNDFVFFFFLRFILFSAAGWCQAWAWPWWIAYDGELGAPSRDYDNDSSVKVAAIIALGRNNYILFYFLFVSIVHFSSIQIWDSYYFAYAITARKSWLKQLDWWASKRRGVPRVYDWWLGLCCRAWQWIGGPKNLSEETLPVQSVRHRFHWFMNIQGIVLGLVCDKFCFIDEKVEEMVRRYCHNTPLTLLVSKFNLQQKKQEKHHSLLLRKYLTPPWAVFLIH